MRRRNEGKSRGRLERGMEKQEGEEHCSVSNCHYSIIIEQHKAF